MVAGWGVLAACLKSVENGSFQWFGEPGNTEFRTVTSCVGSFRPRISYGIISPVNTIEYAVNGGEENGDL